MNTETLDKKILDNSGSSSMELEIEYTEGSFLFDTNGKKYIDFLMGWCVGNLGWGNENIKQTIQNYKGPDYIYPGFTYEPWLELAELLASIAPGKLQTSYRTTGGTESVETAMQIAMRYTGRKKFISIEGSYHGNSIGTLSIGSSENRDIFKNLLPNCLKIERPLDEKAVRKIETRLKKKDVAAFIMEPVICNLGVYIPTKAFMQRVQELCAYYGTLFVMDEVACGFGRTGKLFASEHFEIEPDVLCLSKAISGGYAPLGATMTTEKIAKKVKEDVSIYSTYGWHPLSVQVALANVQYFIKYENELLEHVNRLSNLFKTKLQEMAFKYDTQLNVKGLAIGINVNKAAYAKKIQEECLEKGLILTAQEEHLVLFPALTIKKEEALKGLEILEACV